MLARAHRGSTEKAARMPEVEPTQIASVLLAAPARMSSSGATVRMVAVTRLYPSHGQRIDMNAAAPTLATMLQAIDRFMAAASRTTPTPSATPAIAPTIRAIASVTVPSMVARTTNKAENAPQATSGMRCQVIHA